MYTTIKSIVGTEAENLSNCIATATHWFLDNGLLLNADKTEMIALGTRQQLAKFDLQTPMKIGESDVNINSTVKILDVQLDAKLSMDCQVNSIVKSCNYHIRALRHARSKRSNARFCKDFCVWFGRCTLGLLQLITPRNIEKYNLVKLQHVHCTEYFGKSGPAATMEVVF